MKPPRMLCSGLVAALLAAGLLPCRADREDAERGVSLFRAGDYAGARQAFEAAVQRDAADFRAWQDLGWTVYNLGQTNEAIRIWRDIVAADPAFLRAHNALGHALRLRGEPEAAAAHYAGSLKLQPDQINVRMHLGECLEALQQPGEAVLAYRGVLERQPDHEAAVLRLARMLVQLDRLSEADRLVRGFAPDATTMSTAMRRALASIEAAQGVAAYRSESFAEAADRFGRARELHADHARYAVDLGWALRQAGQMEQALETWTEAALMQPADPGGLCLAMADAAAELGREDSARRLYEKALVENGPHAPTLCRFALLELQSGRADAALALAERSLAAEELNADIVMRLAQALADNGLTGRALPLFEARAKTSPGAVMDAGLTRLYHQEGVEAYRLERQDEAIASFRRALARTPGHLPSLRDLGWAYWHSGDMDACEQVWRDLLDQNPDYSYAHDLLAACYLLRNEYEAAIRHARACLDADPDYVPAKKRLARALIDSGQPGAALPVARDLCALFPEDADLRQALAMTLTKLMDHERAAVEWRAVLDLDPGAMIAQHNWIKSLRAIGKIERAIEFAAHHAAEGTASEAALELLAYRALEQGRYADAEHWFGMLVGRDPYRPAYWLKYSESLAAQGKHARRTAAMKASAQIRPERLDLQLALCAALADAGQYVEALEGFAQLRERYPDSFTVFAGWTDLLRRMGRGRQALASLDQNTDLFYAPHEWLLWRAALLGGLRRYGERRQVLDLLVRELEGRYIVPIILYHGLAEAEGAEAMRVAEFESHMAALRREGYTALLVTELEEAVLAGDDLPPKPILITFDDARSDSFLLADPILDRYDLKATMFVPTARIGQEDLFHLSWNAMRDLARTGRWEMQSHGHEAHNDIPVDRQGRRGFFLGHLRWIADECRHETYAEYEARVRADYAVGQAAIAEQKMGRPVRGFAFPYSAFGQDAPRGGPSQARLNMELTREFFGYGFIQRSTAYTLFQPREPMPLLIRRFTVPEGWSGEKLVEFLAADHPRNQAAIEMAKGATWEGRYELARHQYRQLRSREPVLTALCDRALADLAVRRGRLRAARDILAEDADLFLDNPAAQRRLDWLTRPVVEGVAGYSEDSEGRSTLRTLAHARLPVAGRATVSGGGGVLRFREDGFNDALGSDLEMRAGVPFSSLWTLDADVGIRTLEGADESLTGGFGLRRREDLHDITAGWGYRNIDTLRAQLAGIQFHRVSVLYRFESARWPWQIWCMRWDMTDGNTRDDVRIQGFYRLDLQPRMSWRLGGTIEYIDTAFQAPEYYTPEKLFATRAVAGCDYRNDTWSVGVETAAGVVFDDLNEDRLTLRGALRLSKQLGDRVQSAFSAFYSTTAGYDATGADCSLRYRF